MSRVNVSVILPRVSDKSKFTRFCASLFASELSVELIVCGELPEEVLSAVSESCANKIKLIRSSDTNALVNAVQIAEGDFLLFSDVNVTFAPNAIEKMLVASRGNTAVANVASVNGGKIFSESFLLDELFSKGIYFNFLLSADVVKGNSVTFCGNDALSIMLFIADYCRYDTLTAVNEVLFYTDVEPQCACAQALPYLPQYADIFKATGNVSAELFFLRAVFSALLQELNAEAFEALKAVTAAFAEDYSTLSWLKNTFEIDVAALADENTLFADFKYNGASAFYKEVKLPVTSDSVVKSFYFGKLGIDTLKKCIGAWGYYKFYRRKDDFIKKLGCKLFKKLLGGDFDA